GTETILALLRGRCIEPLKNQVPASYRVVELLNTGWPILGGVEGRAPRGWCVRRPPSHGLPGEGNTQEGVQCHAGEVLCLVDAHHDARVDRDGGPAIVGGEGKRSQGEEKESEECSGERNESGQSGC